MERYELTGDDTRLAAMVAAAEGGEDVTITRDGAVVARVVVAPAVSVEPEPRRSIDLEQLRALRATISWREPDAAALIREMREADDL
ncbi:hypothetical protein U1701_13420 [Sphingomonas sp. PB2P19]|uniref:hypothetical protein n=1 Tax=Sphingomonas rhamnosi TaxID=3096156 RepID=UPI002FCA28F0